MGIDGFSMANLGLNRELPSNKLAMNTEALALHGLEPKIKHVGGLAKKNRVEKSDEDDQKDSDDEAFSFDEEKNDENGHDDNEEQIEENPKRFVMRLDNEGSSVELYDLENKKIIEKISADELVSMISKLNSASGVLINKKI